MSAAVWGKSDWIFYLLDGCRQRAYTIAAQLISGGYNVVFASDDINEDALGKKITPFRISPSDKDFERIFSSYNFGAAVYIAQSIYRKEPYYGEYQDLEAVLRISCEP